MKIVFYLLFLLPTLTYSQTICERHDGGLNQYLTEELTRISFKNKGGLFNGGVCWWHSRLQRASAYLAIYHPELSKPTEEEAITIFKKLKMMKSFVIIPGYSDFLLFSRDYQKQAQKILEDWQIEDGFINQQWIRGISGQYKLPTELLKKKLEDLHTNLKHSKHPLWVMAQIKGITAHAFLVLDMRKRKDGWSLDVIDSNHPLKTITLEFFNGDEQFEHPTDKYSFVLYSGFNDDVNKMNKLISSTCYSIDTLPLPPGEIEIK